jgi:glycosyltransferase involved in cell wall biosynthesis
VGLGNWQNGEAGNFMKPTITAVIITFNEEAMIANCMETLQWCDQIIVIDSHSTDKTAAIAEKYKAKVILTSAGSFAERRNVALSHLKTDWVFYIDADERVVPALSKEILVHMETTPQHAMQLVRQNMMYGKLFEYGGWTEQIARIFRVPHFKGWTGEIHESPTYEGEAVQLHTPLLHLTHRNTIDGLQKTIRWTPIEAQLLYQAKVPKVTVITLLRKGSMEFIRRAFFSKGRKDGMEGWIESLVQGINRILVYIQVWELQQDPSLSEKYHQREKEIVEMWKREK